MIGSTDPVATEHRVDWGNFGWGCSCGAGTEWPLAPESRANAAANRHLAAVTKREWREKTRQANNAAMLRAARHAAGLDDDRYHGPQTLESRGIDGTGGGSE